MKASTAPLRLPSLSLALATALCCAPAFGHGGGLDANGCHTNRKTGDYHCHRGNAAAGKGSKSDKAAAQPRQRLQPKPDALPPGCHVGPRGGTYTITRSGRKNYAGC